MSEQLDNVVYIDEFKRERWLARLNQARKIGEVTIGNVTVLYSAPAEVIPFPRNGDPNDAA